MTFFFSPDPRNPEEAPPWMVPVPLTRGGFSSFDRDGATFDVVTDVASVRPFEIARTRPHNCLWADAQTSPELNSGARLGSGRSGFYRGKYLKGVGRTMLAGNWADVDDVYHGTGHLHPSGAVREYLSSRFMAMHGAADTIVPCETLLLRELPEEFRTHQTDHWNERGVQLKPVDATLQAITVKDGKFGRPSNILWFVDRMAPVSEHIKVLCRAILRFGGQRVPCDAEIGSSQVVDALEAGIRTGLSNFARYQHLGVHWGSFFNNHTLDGRFLDLEVATFVGPGFFGILVPNPENAPLATVPDSYEVFSSIAGLEACSFVATTRRFLSRLVWSVRRLAEASTDRSCAAFLDGLANEVESSFFKGHHLLADKPAFMGWLMKSLSVRDRDVEFVRELADLSYDDIVLGHDVRDRRRVAWRRVRSGFAPAEPIVDVSTFVPEGLAFRQEDGGAVQVLNEGLRQIGELQSVEEVFEATRAVERQLERVLVPNNRVASE